MSLTDDKKEIFAEFAIEIFRNEPTANKKNCRISH